MGCSLPGPQLEPFSLATTNLKRRVSHFQCEEPANLVMKATVTLRIFGLLTRAAMVNELPNTPMMMMTTVMTPENRLNSNDDLQNTKKKKKQKRQVVTSSCLSIQESAAKNG